MATRVSVQVSLGGNPGNKGNEEKMNSHARQCAGEPVRKPSRLKKLALEARDFASRSFDFPQLLEKTLAKFEDAVLEELSEPEDNAAKTQIFKWELK